MAGLRTVANCSYKRGDPTCILKEKKKGVCAGRIYQRNELVPSQVQILGSYSRTFDILFYIKPKAFYVLRMDHFAVRVHKIFTVVYNLLLVYKFFQAFKGTPAVTINNTTRFNIFLYQRPKSGLVPFVSNLHLSALIQTSLCSLFQSVGITTPASQPYLSLIFSSQLMSL